MTLHQTRIATLLVLCSMSGVVGCDEPAHSPSTSSDDSAVAAQEDASRDAGSSRDASGPPKTEANDAGAPAKADASSAANAEDAGSTPTDARANTSGATQTDVSNLNTDFQAWQARVDKLRSCGVLDDGDYHFDPRLDQRCLSLCMIAASCKDLKTEACDLQAAPSLEACFDKCDEDVATCGDGVTVPSESVCDLAKDCSDGEDEKHCTDFACDSGSHVALTSRCDGELDCADESDEQGCALVCGKPYAQSF